MRRKKLDKIKREIARLRRASAKASDLEGLASGLGRRMVKRGKHPLWESRRFDELFVLSIPRHGGKELSIGTKRCILDQLEEDVLAWEETLEDDDEGEDDENGADTDVTP